MAILEIAHLWDRGWCFRGKRRCSRVIEIRISRTYTKKAVLTVQPLRIGQLVRLLKNDLLADLRIACESYDIGARGEVLYRHRYVFSNRNLLSDPACKIKHL